MNLHDHQTRQGSSGDLPRVRLNDHFNSSAFRTMLPSHRNRRLSSPCRTTAARKQPMARFLSEPPSSRDSREIQFKLVDKTPAPILPRLYRPNDWVLRTVKMLRGVLVLRRIAAAHMAARHTQAQMHPGIAHLQALLA